MGNLWKEWNSRIFNENPSSREVVWNKIHTNIQETLNLDPWTEEEFKCTSSEAKIWDNWGFTILMSSNTPK